MKKQSFVLDGQKVEVLYQKRLSDLMPKNVGAKTLLIFDKKLLRLNPKLKNVVSAFDASYAVTAGEGLKELKDFYKHAQHLGQLLQKLSGRNTQVYAMGGGSVGDFAGFVASVFFRGMKLHHIPSTWLACIDSAHGGKTALNLNAAKNQIGSFYLPKQILINKELLDSQNMALAQDAMGEICKTYFLSANNKIKQTNASNIWSSLPALISYKYKIVKQDFKEEKQIRKILNLGHSFGHIIESHFGISHGQAVAQGLFFSLNWSLQKNVLNLQEFSKALEYMKKSGFESMQWQQDYKCIDKKTFLNLAMKDKKRKTDDSFDFVFLKAPGKIKINKQSFDEFYQEAKRQMWVK